MRPDHQLAIQRGASALARRARRPFEDAFTRSRPISDVKAEAGRSTWPLRRNRDPRLHDDDDDRPAARTSNAHWAGVAVLLKSRPTKDTHSGALMTQP